MKKLSLVVLLAICSISSATTIWSDNFDYAAGQTLQDNGWQLSVGGTYGRQGLDSTVSVSPTNSLTQWTIPWAPYQMIVAKHSFTSTAKGSLGIDIRSSHSVVPENIITARFYITSDTGTIAQFQFAAQWGISINGAGYGSYNANQWYHIDLSWDDSTKMISANVAGDSYVLTANYIDASASGANLLNIMNNANSDQAANVQTWYDNVVVTPEPATLSMLGLGIFSLIRRRK